ncbi:MAG: hypothetical protein K6A30_01170 [Lachnospiraceae bacterium]|nr:hypothetical protein [Lachnospiraceae bacterium]
METCLKNALLKVTGMEFESENMRNMNVFGNHVRMNARDLVMVLATVEKELGLHVDDSLILSGSFNTFNNIIYGLKNAKKVA